jgi:XTP/dITP diphosphohydrolase
MQLIIASGNTHKVEEFEELLSGLDIEVCSAQAAGGMPEVDETGTTFTANAELKACALSSQAPKGSLILADDSGLEVDFLSGAPGIYSARYAGLNATDAANRNKLLAALSLKDEVNRSARFRCVLCLLDTSGNAKFFEGSCEGKIATEARGNEGFGYDPIFIPEGYEESFGELGESFKSKLSHRAKAVDSLRAYLEKLFQ